jgi:hypothetical protein
MLHEATLSLRIDGDPGRNFTLVAVACCPTVGANCYVILGMVAIGWFIERASRSTLMGLARDWVVTTRERTQVQGPPLRR